MSYNPIDGLLSELESAYRFERSRKVKLAEELRWYDTSSLEGLREESRRYYDLLERLRSEKGRLSSSKTRLKRKLEKKAQQRKTVLNPGNWFSSSQRKIRRDVLTLKRLLQKRESALRNKIEEISNAKESGMISEQRIEEFLDFDRESKMAKLSSSQERIDDVSKELKTVREEKKNVDHVISPLIREISKYERKLTVINVERDIAEGFNDELKASDNSYDRAMIHKKCLEKFGDSSPNKIVRTLGADAGRLESSLRKVRKRAELLGRSAARVVKKIVVDGSNLCYKNGDEFIGLRALSVLSRNLNDRYKVIVVFDGSIRKLVNAPESDIKGLFPEGCEIHICAMQNAADETILDLASDDRYTYVLSNDGFLDFPEKEVVASDRLIRHEIVGGVVLVHELGVTEVFE